MTLNYILRKEVKKLCFQDLQTLHQCAGNVEEWRPLVLGFMDFVIGVDGKKKKKKKGKGKKKKKNEIKNGEKNLSSGDRQYDESLTAFLRIMRDAESK